GHLIDVAHLVVHHPDVGVADVEDLAGGALHDAGEDGDLLRHQQGGEGDAKDDADVLAPVAGEHFPRDPGHGSFPPALNRPRAASEKSATWSAMRSTVNERSSSSPIKSGMTWRPW